MNGPPPAPAPAHPPAPPRQGWRRWRHSIKGRLVALFVLLALATSAVFFLGTQRLVVGVWQQLARPIVADYLDRLAAEIGSPPDTARAAAIAARLPVTIRIDGPVVVWRSPGVAAGPESFGWRPGLDRREHAREHGLYGADGLLVRATADGHRIVFGLRGPEGPLRTPWPGWGTLAVLLALTALAYLAVRRLLAPLADITLGVEAFGRGELTHRIAVRRADELGDLAGRVNEMAARLHAMLEAKRSLLLAISHELRSPLTRARVNAELVAEGDARDALLRDLGEMGELITSLLESERLTQGHAALHAETADLGAIVREVAAARQALIDARGTRGAGPAALELAVEDHEAVVDATRVRLLLRNLIDNALRHGADAATPPRVYLRRESDGQLALGVRDFGRGLPAEELPRLAQAFYRPDAARTRSAGGVGLGLYLCRLVAEAHGGRLRVAAANPGLDVAMVWPG